jgi:hypothetical protein
VARQSPPQSPSPQPEKIDTSDKWTCDKCAFTSTDSAMAAAHEVTNQGHVALPPINNPEPTPDPNKHKL